MTGHESDYIFQFANAVARQVDKTHPDKHCFVLAYAGHAFPPSFPLDPSIYVGPCLSSRQWISPGDPAAFRAWVAAEQKVPGSEVRAYKLWVAEKKQSHRLLSMWLYHCHPTEFTEERGYHAFFGYHAHTLANQLQMFAADGIDGIFTCGIGEQVDTYVTCKFLDNPHQDIQALLDEFFTRYYGAAGAPLERLYNLVEATYSNRANYPAGYTFPQHQTEEVAWGYLGTGERMATMSQWRDQALTAQVSDLERQRVELFDQGPWQYMVEGHRQWVAKGSHAAEREALMRQDPPTVHAPALPEAGGDGAKADWTRAGHFSIKLTHDGYPAPRQIGVEIAHDSQYLYLRLTDPVGKGGVKLENDGFFSGDHWEIFLAAQRGTADIDKGKCHQWGVKPGGQMLCYTFPGCHEWHESGARVQCQVNDQGWVTTFVVPLQAAWALTDKPGEKVYLNLYRCAAAGGATLAWSPNFTGGYRNPSRFGEVLLDR
jgi:hypothetical protein